MWTRRQLLARGTLGLLGAAGTCLAVPGDAAPPADPLDAVPDGSASKNMITSEAEAAVERVQNDTRARMARQTDPFLRDRLHDFEDLANRLLRELMGHPHGPFADRLPDDAIVVARNMGPAELLDYF